MNPRTKHHFMTLVPAIVALLLLLSTAPSAHAQSPTVIYVNASAAPGGNGASWATAYREIEPALADAKLLPVATRNVQIWVARGVYFPTRRLIANEPRSVVFELASGISILGGFAGGEVLASQANPTANVTQISGNIGSPADVFDNAFRLFLIQSATSVKLDGLTITDAFSQSQNNLSYPGCAVYVANSVVELSRLSIRANGDFGTAQITVVLATGVGTSLTVRDTEFRSNSRTAIHCAPDAQISVQRCQFLNNIGQSPLPGAILAQSRTRTDIVGCRFIRNTGPSGAVLLQSDSGVFNIVNCEFLGNNAGVGGGAIGTLANTLAGSATVLIANSLFAWNVAQAGSGGAIAVSGMSANIVNCTITRNSQAGGGAITASVSTLNIPTSISVRNTIIWQNPSASNEWQRNLFLVSSPLVTNAGISNCLIGGWNGSLASTNVSAADPGMLDVPNPGPDGFWLQDTDVLTKVRLASTSPAIDAGSNAALPADVTDLDGDGDLLEPLPLDLYDSTRRRDDPVTPDAGVGTAPIVDIGCVEYWYDCSTCAGPREWRNPTGGNFLDNFNWYPSTPTAQSDTVYDLAAIYSVQWPLGSAFTNRSATVSRGSVRWIVPPTTSYSLTSLGSPSMTVGSSSGIPASLTVSGGGQVRPASVTVARDPGSSGILEIAGPGTRMAVTSQDLVVGFQGTGMLRVADGATLVTRTASVGYQPGSFGSVRLEGLGSSWSTPFFLSVSSGSVHVGSGALLETGFGLYNFQEGILSGSGTIRGPVVNFGLLSPGSSPGTLTIDGSYEQIGFLPEFGSDSGKLELEVAGDAPGQADKLIVTGPTELGGGLFINFLDNYRPAPGSSLGLQLVSAGVLDPDARFDVAYLPPVLSPAGMPDGRFLKVEYPAAAPLGIRAAGDITLALGSLGSPITYLPPDGASVDGTPTGVAIGDLNGDGLDDLAISVPSSANPTGTGGSVVILINRGGDWQGFPSAGGPGSIQLATANEPRGLVIADIDGDGRKDLAVANASSDTVSLFANTTPAPASATFAPAGSVSFPGRPVDLVADNFNGPDRRDLAVACEDADSVTVRRAVGAGFVFDSAAVSISMGSKPRSVAAFNPDQDKDVNRKKIVAAYFASNTVGVINTASATVGGSLTLSPLQTINVAPGPVKVVAQPLVRTAGVNRIAFTGGGAVGQGRTVLITVNQSAASNATASVIAPNPDPDTQATVPFNPAVDIPAGLSPRGVIAADLDADLDDELVIVTNVGTTTTPDYKLRVLRNDLLTGTTANQQLAFVFDRDIDAGVNPLFVVQGRLVTDDPNAPRDLVTVNDPPAIASNPADAATLGQEPNVRPLRNRTTTTPLGCSPADIANTDGDPLPDNSIDNGDFTAFFNAFFLDSSDPARLIADIANTDGDTTLTGAGPDGTVDNGDFTAFFNFFFEGCGIM